MSRVPVERALAAARNAHSIQRPNQAVIILHAPLPKSEEQQAIHEQEIADLKQQVRHTRGRAQP